jgi:DNA-binding transcriptional regulator YiaG
MGMRFNVVPYHYTECGLRNVWLQSGYTVHKTPYGKGVSIRDVDGLHALIGRSLANKPKLSGAELRFLRKELGLSQAALGRLVGTSEQNVSLWERRGRIPKASDRLVRLIYVEKTSGNVKVRELIERLSDQDSGGQRKLTFAQKSGNWKEAA